MPYTTLYRKYRPAGFEDVKGQDHIVTTLKNQIRAKRIGHAYLFCGTRGTGKTTAAKIFARAVNCENPVDGSPCGSCGSCRSIAAGRSMNVIEIDAASNNGVDDVRRIREEVEYAPTEGHYKVYIIDEVHMLSGAAHNALLKTLEEPPPYVIFILATTEPHRLPVTILSRCQRYDFRRITLDVIEARLRELMNAEEVEAEEKALRYIAKMADGSMRDALSLLDQCIAFYMGQRLTYENVLEVLGSVETEVFSRLLRALISGNAAEAILVLEDVVARGRDLTQFVIDFIWYLRNLLLVQNGGDAEAIMDASAERIELLKEEAKMVDGEVLMRYIRVLSELSGQIRYAPQKRVLTEVALMKLCRPQMEQTQDALADRVAKLEAKLERGIPVVPEQSAPAAAVQTVKENPRKKELPKAVPEDLEKLIRNWQKIIPKLGEDYKKYKHCLDKTTNLGLEFEVADDEAQGSRLTLIYPKDRETPDYSRVSEEKFRSHLENTISEMIGKQIRLEIRLDKNTEDFRDHYNTVDEFIEFLSSNKVTVENESYSLDYITGG